MREKWYALKNPKDKQPVCYLKEKNYLVYLKENNICFGQLTKLSKRPSQLEFLVKENNETIGSFKFESHAIKYSLQKSSKEMKIIHNPQYKQLEINF